MSSATQGLNTQQFIDGLLVAGEGPEEQLLNPASGEVLLLLAEASAQQVSDAVESAQRAFPSWSRTIPARRAAVLLAIADVIERHATMFAEIESLNCGKPDHQAL
ncbi:MAG: aldehyde dehydrogenase family protein, partial [Enterobacterales bacterium]|nr:aldehyde dehydrogenase family protein [Enterobacterales bacterium]